MWYASDQEQAAWAELFRHLLTTELHAFELRRRVGKVTINDLEVLDLTDAGVQDSLGLETSDLVDTSTASPSSWPQRLSPSGLEAFWLLLRRS